MTWTRLPGRQVSRAARPAPRPLVAGLAAFLLCGGIPAVAAPGPVPLGAVLRLSGTGAAFTTVRLARPMKIAEYTAFAASATGSPGPIALLLLSAEVPAEKAPFFLVDRSPLALGGEWGFTSDVPADDTLPAGTYRAFVVADSPTTISLRLPGQRGGTTSLATRQKVRYRIGIVPVDRPGGRYRQVGETNETWTLQRPGLVLAYAVIDFSVRHTLAIGGCWYDGRPPPQEATLQTCHGGDRVLVGNDAFVPRGQERTRDGGLLYRVQPRVLTFGIYYETTGVIERVSRYNIWLEYLP